ncbi:unnamed protein product [Rhizoctonia solani]|uniref:RING-type domain-containing protein n=1 Tax=Rhizoctonia solani TaxID=456999 RepID=A0A8H3E3Y6_9AGAM|nr:unnamed protein product [Rhizoctonia solani]
MEDDGVHTNPEFVESWVGNVVCPICSELRGEMKAFLCGHLICRECVMMLRLESGPGSEGMKYPVKCYNCPKIIERGTLRRVIFEVAPFTYEAPLQRYLAEQAALSKEYEEAKRSREELIQKLQQKTSDLAELSKQIQKIEGLKRELIKLGWGNFH